MRFFLRSLIGPQVTWSVRDPFFFFFYFFSRPNAPWRRRRRLQRGGIKKKKLKGFLLKFVSVLLSASVERVGISRMRDFFYIYILSKRQTRRRKIFLYKSTFKQNRINIQSENTVFKCNILEIINVFLKNSLELYVQKATLNCLKSSARVFLKVQPLGRGTFFRDCARFGFLNVKVHNFHLFFFFGSFLIFVWWYGPLF